MAVDADHTIYRPLDETEFHIRLLQFSKDPHEKITAIMRHFKLGQAPEYHALSYVWGPVVPNSVIDVNQEAFVVRQNLRDFLDVITSRDNPNTQWYWIDQISINQHDLHERSSQVSMMGEIFARADCVITWLGLDEHAGRAFRFIRSVNNSQSDRERRNERSVPAVMKTLANLVLTTVPWMIPGCDGTAAHELFLFFGCVAQWFAISLLRLKNPADKMTRVLAILLEDSDAMQAFFNHKYWSRVWIAQEIAFAMRLKILYGDEEISGQELHDFCSVDFGMRYIPWPIQWLDNLHQTWHGNSNDMHPGLFEALEMTEQSACEKARDVVYGINSLIHQDQQLEVDYSKPIGHIFAEAAAILAYEHVADYLDARQGYDKGNGILIRSSRIVGNSRPSAIGWMNHWLQSVAGGVVFKPYENPSPGELTRSIHTLGQRMHLFNKTGLKGQVQWNVFSLQVRRRIWIWKKAGYTDREGRTWRDIDAKSHFNAVFMDILSLTTDADRDPDHADCLPPDISTYYGLGAKLLGLEGSRLDRKLKLSDYFNFGSALRYAVLLVGLYSWEDTEPLMAASVCVNVCIFMLLEEKS